MMEEDRKRCRQRWNKRRRYTQRGNCVLRLCLWPHVSTERQQHDSSTQYSSQKTPRKEGVAAWEHQNMVNMHYVPPKGASASYSRLTLQHLHSHFED